MSNNQIIPSENEIKSNAKDFYKLYIKMKYPRENHTENDYNKYEKNIKQNKLTKNSSCKSFLESCIGLLDNNFPSEVNNKIVISTAHNNKSISMENKMNRNNSQNNLRNNMNIPNQEEIMNISFEEFLKYKKDKKSQINLSKGDKSSKQKSKKQLTSKDKIKSNCINNNYYKKQKNKGVYTMNNMNNFSSTQNQPTSKDSYLVYNNNNTSVTNIENTGASSVKMKHTKYTDFINRAQQYNKLKQAHIEQMRNTSMEHDNSMLQEKPILSKNTYDLCKKIKRKPLYENPSKLENDFLMDKFKIFYNKEVGGDNGFNYINDNKDKINYLNDKDKFDKNNKKIFEHFYKNQIKYQERKEKNLEKLTQSYLHDNSLDQVTPYKTNKYQDGFREYDNNTNNINKNYKNNINKAYDNKKYKINRKIRQKHFSSDKFNQDKNKIKFDFQLSKYLKSINSQADLFNFNKYNIYNMNNITSNINTRNLLYNKGKSTSNINNMSNNHSNKINLNCSNNSISIDKQKKQAKDKNTFNNYNNIYNNNEKENINVDNLKKNFVTYNKKTLKDYQTKKSKSPVKTNNEEEPVDKERKNKFRRWENIISSPGFGKNNEEEDVNEVLYKINVRNCDSCSMPYNEFLMKNNDKNVVGDFI